MRTLTEIIETTKDGEKPTYEECYYAMLALSTLHANEQAALNELANGITKDKIKITLQASHDRNKNALSMPPNEWLGNNVPGQPSYDSMRKITKIIAKKVLE